MSQTRRKRPTNLSLAPARLAFAHGYAEAHATSLSELVENLLSALEQVARPPSEMAASDPLDGILLGTSLAPLDKKALRRERHEARLAQ